MYIKEKNKRIDLHEHKAASEAWKARCATEKLQMCS
jgi:hypothetical protein